MEVTRRYWEAVTLAVILAVGGILLNRRVLLAGGITLCVWLLATQIRFVRRLDQTVPKLTIDQSLVARRGQTDEKLPVTLDATLDHASSLSLTVEGRPPVPAEGISPDTFRIELPAGETTATTTTTHTYPIAGKFTFDRPKVSARDHYELFTETFFAGPTPSIRIDPRVPRRIHIGMGGNQIAVAYGEHPTGRTGSGIEPGELREYQPGDPARRIDWKASARLNEPFVRTFETESTLMTALVIDHSSSTAVGADGETAFAYLREVALGLTTNTQRQSDPLGLYAVGDGGLTVSVSPGQSSEQYDRIRQHLLDIEPTHDTEAEAARIERQRPSREIRTVLQTDETSYGRTLQAFLGPSQTYALPMAETPLVETMRLQVSRLSGTVRTLLFTDDSDREQLREFVRLGRLGNGHVIVFLAPQVLFEPRGLADLDAAYERYTAFEEFRRELSRIDRVTAYEVAPDDRITAVLSGRGRQSDTRTRDSSQS